MWIPTDISKFTIILQNVTRVYKYKSYIFINYKSHNNYDQLNGA